jgi:hypothetical protein
MTEPKHNPELEALIEIANIVNAPQKDWKIVIGFVKEMKKTICLQNDEQKKVDNMYSNIVNLYKDSINVRKALEHENAALRQRLNG